MTYHPAKEPWDHQLEAEAKMGDKEAFALLMAMRTGKSKVTLDNFGRLEDKKRVEDLLITAPAGVYRTWETAYHEHLPPAFKERASLFTWRAGAGAKEERILEMFLKPKKDRPRVLLVNTEAFSNVERARDLAEEFLDQRTSMMAVDESTTIKNHASKRTKFINRHLGRSADLRRILSGLPTPKSPLDLYSQFEFLDQRILGFNSFFSFRSRYAVMRPMEFGGRRFQVVVGHRNEKELWNKIEPYSYRKRLEDCYQLPAKMYSMRFVPMTKEQKEIYNSIKNYATAKLGEESFVTATQVITQLLRMHQVLCGFTKDEFGQLHEIPENKTSTLIDALDEYDGKAIIWCAYDYNVRKVSAALEKNFKVKVARFWGGNKDTREAEEKMFLNDKDCPYMVATAAAGGRGRTWTVADLTIYHSNTYDLEHRSQSEERPQGVNKLNSVGYMDLVCAGTVEEKILKALKDKIVMASVITGDNFREWLI